MSNSPPSDVFDVFRGEIKGNGPAQKSPFGLLMTLIRLGRPSRLSPGRFQARFPSKKPPARPLTSIPVTPAPDRWAGLQPDGFSKLYQTSLCRSVAAVLWGVPQRLKGRHAAGVSGTGGVWMGHSGSGRGRKYLQSVTLWYFLLLVFDAAQKPEMVKKLGRR